MKFTLGWLKQFLETNASLDQIASTLTALGLEVEDIVDRKSELNGFIVAEILDARPHPNAQKLQICTVFDGQKELQVVCGAPNARAGLKVVLATVGSIVPSNGLVIKQSKIREIESQGMLCSATELKLGTDSSGIIELDSNFRVGEQFATEAGLDDPLIDLSVTPNRGDCLGVYGVARELAAAKLGLLKKPNISESLAEEFNCPISINIDANSGCKRFLARYFSAINNNTAVDPALNKYLIAIGAKSISTLVDITNYICYAYSRPLHAYDADKIQGAIRVRRANAGEKFVALNDITYEMQGDETVVCDDDGIISLAGIIGGKRCAVDLNTKNALLEVALFDPLQIAKAGRAHKIESESRYRMERKLDEMFVEQADFIASKMILQYNGGKASKKLDQIEEHFIYKEIYYSPAYFEKKAGFKLDSDIIREMLLQLGCCIKTIEGGSFHVEIPSFRHDLTIADDITEEILRLYGYDNIPPLSILNDQHIQIPSLEKKLSIVQQFARTLATNGYHEVVTWSFMHKAKAAYFGNIIDSMQLLNPISRDLAYMRPSIISNLLDTLKLNQDRGFFNLSFMEIGPIFSDSYPNSQTKVCTGIRSGLSKNKTVHSEAVHFDIFDVKRDLFMLIQQWGLDPATMTVTQEESAKQYYHPAQSATLRMGKNVIAYFGKLHPKILSAYEVNPNTYAFELLLDNLPEIKTKHGKRLPTNFSDYQAVQRDFAFIFDKCFPAGNLIKMIEAIDKKLIQNVEIFDAFTSPALGDDKKSIGINVTIQANDRTLTDLEIDNITQQIILTISSKAGGILRG
jgi:phenylalanyl-tRNA synthetase beta chain